MATRTKVALVFDDGFAASSRKTADLFESFGLRAVFSVLADPTNLAPKIAVGSPSKFQSQPGGKTL